LGYTDNMNFIFSLTSYPARFEYLDQVLDSLRNQRIPGDFIVLNIAKEDKPLLKLNSYANLEVNFVEDLKAMKKLLPTLTKYPEHNIITVDDDTIYPKKLSERLITGYEKNPGNIIAGRARKITKNKDEFNEYLKWTPLYHGHPSDKLVFPNGVGGVFYPKNIFHPDVFDESFYKNFVTTDDFWWYTQARRNGVQFVQVSIFNRLNFPNIMPIASKGLFYYKNKTENDKAFKMLLDAYGNFVD
jgi:hypothetical protein